jgi:activator of HSP90 ATPase
MSNIIQQTVTLSASAERLFDMYLDPGIHEAFTGAPVIIDSEEGSEFQAFNNMIFGKMLFVVPKNLIVQSWRAAHWKIEDLDSILILTFWPAGDSGRIELVHVNVPDHDFKGVSQGWENYYWKPWQEYLLNR